MHTHYLVPFLSVFNTDAAAACQYPLGEPQEGYAQEQARSPLSFMVTFKDSIYLN